MPTAGTDVVAAAPSAILIAAGTAPVVVGITDTGVAHIALHADAGDRAGTEQRQGGAQSDRAP
jgi:hypothetical protein